MHEFGSIAVHPISVSVKLLVKNFIWSAFNEHMSSYLLWSRLFVFLFGNVGTFLAVVMNYSRYFSMQLISFGLQT